MRGTIERVRTGPGRLGGVRPDSTSSSLSVSRSTPSGDDVLFGCALRVKQKSILQAEGSLELARKYKKPSRWLLVECFFHFCNRGRRKKKILLFFLGFEPTSAVMSCAEWRIDFDLSTCCRKHLILFRQLSIRYWTDFFLTKKERLKKLNSKTFFVCNCMVSLVDVTGKLTGPEAVAFLSVVETTKKLSTNLESEITWECSNLIFRLQSRFGRESNRFRCKCLWLNFLSSVARVRVLISKRGYFLTQKFGGLFFVNKRLRGYVLITIKKWVQKTKFEKLINKSIKTKFNKINKENNSTWKE